MMVPFESAVRCSLEGFMRWPPPVSATGRWLPRYTTIRDATGCSSFGLVISFMVPSKRKPRILSTRSRLHGTPRLGLKRRGARATGVQCVALLDIWNCRERSESAIARCVRLEQWLPVEVHVDQAAHGTHIDEVGTREVRRDEPAVLGVEIDVFPSRVGGVLVE